jgi:hypothetical protein
MTTYISFTEDGSCGSITDTDGQFILPENFESKLALRYKLVDNVITDLYPGMTDDEVLNAIFEANEAKKVPPSPPEPPVPKRYITKLAFRNRFTSQEKVALEIAALDDPSKTMQERSLSARLRVNQVDVQAATYIDLDRPDTREGVMALESIGLLAAGRALTILDAPVTIDEVYVK